MKSSTWRECAARPLMRPFIRAPRRPPAWEKVMSQYKPEGHNAVSPYLLVASVGAQLRFLEAAFGAATLRVTELPDGTVKHAEVRIDDSVVMMGERPDGRGPMPCSTHVYVPDVDATYRAALDAGAMPVSEPKDQPYGDRTAGVRDPEGNIWWVGARIGT
jgi:uncharacterized glyoxalase superfamily protein PhnB